MLGIGGGAIMVPLLVWFFEAQGLPKAHILHLRGHGEWRPSSSPR